MFSNTNLLILILPEFKRENIKIGESIHIKFSKTNKEHEAKIFQIMQGQSGCYFLCLDIWSRNFLETEGEAYQQVWNEEATSSVYFNRYKPSAEIIGMTRKEFIDFFAIEPNKVDSTVKTLFMDFQNFEKKVIDSIQKKAKE